ncbi:hypothetical protein L211DRAFT_854434 [Terfezia boudieri ATCC MYA-4762]|uniref:DUF6532 domain-containing protein n=1 Tax=Terfezia boudieri ATCC MYA-4762 TaxID=1051890 RepID=A0A3N4LJM5_9PEZI|nr:hypothetical protein L211DRAFT_854434 [Terfezia boudieri ATCC MYA-4762]
MYRAAKLGGPTSDHKKPSAMRGRTTSDGGLTRKRRDQMNELEGNKCLQFQEPTQCLFLSALDIINLIDEAWEGAQDQEKSYLRRTKACEQVLKSIHSRNRSYIVHECHQKILRLYRLDYKSKEEVAKKVDWLLHKDRFVCREEQRERPKMRGKRVGKFFDNINHVFICLVAAAMQHCLKELKTGEATEAIEFKYEMAAATFHCLQNTWGLYDEKVRTLILANIKADLRTRIGGFDKKAEMEASDPCAVVEGESYISELQNELKNTMLAQNLVGSDALSEETRNQGNTVVKEAIEKIDADVRDDQWEGSPTDVDEPVEVDNGDWQESQVAY